MKLIAPPQIDEIFHALNSQIAVADGEPVSLVVIGETGNIVRIPEGLNKTSDGAGL